MCRKVKCVVCAMNPQRGHGRRTREIWSLCFPRYFNVIAPLPTPRVFVRLVLVRGTNVARRWTEALLVTHPDRASQ